MKKFMSLLKVNLSDYLQLVGKAKYKLHLSLFFAYALISLFYFGIMYGLYRGFSLLEPIFKDSDTPQLIIAVVMAFSSIFALVKAYMSANTFIFNTKDYDRLFCLPIKSKTIVLSKVFSLYIYLLIYTLIVMIPAYVTYMQVRGFSVFYLIEYIIFVLFLPICPMVLGTLIRFVLEIVDIKKIYKKIINALFYLVLIGYFVYKFSVIITKFSTNKNVNVDYIVNWFYNYNVIGRLGYIGIENNKFFLYLLFILISVGLFIGLIILLGIFYKLINNKEKQNESVVRPNKPLSFKQTKGSFIILLKKEFMLFGKIPTYLAKTISGPILAIIIIYIVLYNAEMRNLINQFLSAIGIYKRDEDDIIFFMCQIVMLFCYSMTTTSSSLSVEGNRLWILKSLPIRPWELILTKVILNVILSLPLLVITGIVLYFKLSPSNDVIIYGYSTIILYILCISCVGMYFDIKYPRLYVDTYSKQINKGTAITITTIFAFVIVGFMLFVGYSMYEIVSTTQMMKYEMALSFAFMILALMMLIRNGFKRFKEIY